VNTPFIFPSITSLPPGYDCTISIPTARLLNKVARDGIVRCLLRVFHDGITVHTEEHIIEIRHGQTQAGLPTFRWPDHSGQWNGGAGFLEIGFRADDGKPMFRDTRVVGFYAIYSKANKKSFFSDNAFRYGSPPIINQIAAFGRYIDAYPVIHVDRKRDLGETLTLINPYEKPVLATVITHDGREIRRRRVNPNSALNIRLIELLRDDENDWMGQIQLTATNRLVTFHIKHSLADPEIISDHEHLDPFRSDKTHYPLTQMIRLRLGDFLHDRGWLS
jgi:hypothetical protein